ncbi:FAD:protein FMN transferase [Zongyangia hominis]|uniref:FAD:protein FMN transferase n=1 Tax=Zongyangia hominis TaxID=2763677 RepID=A0A926E8M2_9FIRM|nr:FAD:protein FMN transferase [Zongyangia hominis]MBC8569332.1 FAD:protein FMN transferase [Zongyangia hominis]
MSKNRRIWAYLVAGVTLAAIVAFGWIYSARKGEAANSERFMMDTIISQTVYGPKAQETVNLVNDQLSRFENLISMHLDGSEVAQINKNAGMGYVKVSKETFDLISVAKTMSEQSGGLFDITIAPLTNLWGITSGNTRIPSQQEIDEAKALVDYRDILLNEEETSIMLRRKGQALDLGGIAKGMASDMVREIYGEQKITSADISLGGNVLVIGKNPQGKDFSIGIRDPRGTANEMIAAITMENKVEATTGDYERYFEKDGKRYHHVIDPRTGYPCETDLIQATVVCENGMMADFLSTTLFMMGRDQVLKYADNGVFDFIIVDKDKNVYVSPGLQDSFRQNGEKGEYTFYEAKADG